ncbi:GNAT family N-acetyltransferase [Pseudactinotalea suaedae]|uniref:GNAT family N-acetyltransferase n=1 Tax=Pseudactinotalea suaedae TaxID=1524924 RepID=UPI001F4FFD07|nr:GNAT family N-acetyltransferase [Pseudactinotalea suaedae]
MSELPQLPPGLTAHHLRATDVEALADLLGRIRERTRGHGGADVDSVRSTAVGIGSWTRHQLLVRRADLDDGVALAWASAHDRAAGRTDLVLHVDRSQRDAEAVAIALLDWLDATAAAIAQSRDLSETLLEILVDAGDEEMQGWLARHGHHRARRWLNMSRPVAPGEQLRGREGVAVRRVRTHDLGDGTTMPVAEDLQAVHRVLERSFADHFNSYRESFGEFVQRLREDSGHRWDHWWLATVQHEGHDLVAGALVSTVSPADASGVEGSYVSYIGVDRLARGRGVAKALLATVINDASERGRNRVGLEVDADSPTGADGLYRSLGWETSYVTESWQKRLTLS